MSAENSSALVHTTVPLRRYPCTIIMPSSNAARIKVHGPVNHCCSSGVGAPIIAYQALPRCPVPQYLPPTTCCRHIHRVSPSFHCRRLWAPDLSHESIQLLPLGRMLQMIPKASCSLVTSKLTTILNKVVRFNDHESWKSLLSFLRRFLRMPKRG